MQFSSFSYAVCRGGVGEKLDRKIQPEKSVKVTWQGGRYLNYRFFTSFAGCNGHLF